MKVRNEKPVEQVVAAIEAMDLDPIKFKLMDADEGEGWSREQVERIETAYRQFLTLLVKYPDSTIAPSKEVDKFWHGHILDTMKYAEDCEQVFGYFLHHFPYFGMRGNEDAAALTAAGKETQRLYAQEFGRPEAKSAAYCMAAKPSYCMASKQATEAAYCMASKPSYCMAAVKAAYCMASKPSYCMASKEATGAAYCMASKPSYCMASKQATEAAYCMASRQAANEAYCMASLRSSKFDRPTLAMAA
jgi:hypothetical protein